MAVKTILLKLAVASSVLVCVVPCPSTIMTERRRARRWDFFIFAQEYPPGVCQAKNEDESIGGCTFSKNTSSFTMHGIWPTATGSIGPVYCNNRATFNPSDIQDLVPLLVTGWTNLWPSSGFYYLWSHEWLKHGTCASGITSMSTEHGYFATTLKLLAKYNFITVLAQQDIKPSNETTYTVQSLTQAFEIAYGIMPLLQCAQTEVGQVLVQISICLQKNFEIMPCDNFVLDSPTACNPNEDVYLIASWY